MKKSLKRKMLLKIVSEEVIKSTFRIGKNRTKIIEFLTKDPLNEILQIKQ